MRTVRATDANRQFSSVLKKVSQGEEFLIVSRGKPVATIAPARVSEKARLASLNILMKRLRVQKAVGARNWTREELYNRNS